MSNAEMAFFLEQRSMLIILLTKKQVSCRLNLRIWVEQTVFTKKFNLRYRSLTSNIYGVCLTSIFEYYITKFTNYNK